MARNKYPEITEARILDTATKLFLANGWEQTTIQDIVDELGDMTRGAFYHHFKSKADSRKYDFACKCMVQPSCILRYERRLYEEV